MNNMPKKQQYNSPEIQRINLDNEIALVLISGNPGNPGGSNNMNPANQFKVPEYFNQQPIIDTMG
jgi:hypothetical protein